MSNKLKCDAHHRRIVATETAFLHKTGDNSTCDSPTATIGDRTRPVGWHDLANGDWIIRFDNEETTQRTDYPELYVTGPKGDHCLTNCVLDFGHHSECVVDGSDLSPGEKLVQELFAQAAESLGPYANC